MSSHIRLARLETRKWHCTITVDGVAQNLDSCYIAFTVKKNYTQTDGQALFQLDIPQGGVSFTNTASGMYDLTIHSTATQGVTKSDKATVFVFDHRIQLSDGSVKQLEAGDFVVLPNVTDTISTT